MSTQDPEAHPAPLKFNNDHLDITVKHLPHCVVQLQIIVSAEAVKNTYKQALKSIRKEVSLPGFRKGKAPEDFVKQNFADTIKQEWMDLVLRISFNEAVHLSNLYPLQDGKTQSPKVISFSEDSGAEFTIEYEHAPVIPQINLEQIELKKHKEKELTSQEEENAYHNILLKFATFTPVEDRGIEDEDFVNVSLTLLEEPPREVIRNQRGQMTSTGFPNWLREKIRGLKVGEHAEGMTEQDETLGQIDPNFQPAPYRVSIHAISTGQLPELDEEMLKKIGVTSEEDLRAKIKERLERDQKNTALNQTVTDLEDFLLKHYPFDIPATYLSKEVTYRLNNLIADKKEQNESYSAQDIKELKSYLEKQVSQHLQLYFLYKKLANDHKIAASPEDISQELMRQMDLLAHGQGQLDISSNNEKEIKHQLQNLAYDRKIKQFLIDHAKFVE